MTPERFAQLWRHLHGDEPIPDDRAEHVLLDPPSKNRFAHRDQAHYDSRYAEAAGAAVLKDERRKWRDQRRAEAQAACDACAMADGHADTADAADAAVSEAGTYEDPRPGADDFDRNM